MKVLIISHNPITTYQNMGKTLKSLFSVFKKEELCQLYIYPTIPDIDVCSSYYRITDIDVLKSYFNFYKVNSRKISASQISCTNTMFEKEQYERIYRNTANKHPYRRILRYLIWKYAKWYNEPLLNWIQEQKPTLVFIAPGSGEFLYDIALKISVEMDLPIITYICDDYYFIKRRLRLLESFESRLLKRKIEKLLIQTSSIIAICKELEVAYSKKFSKISYIIMTGSSYPVADKEYDVDYPKIITYMGNIRCNRYLSLLDIGLALDEINEEQNTDFQLHIYSAEKNKTIISSFSKAKSIKFCGFASGERYDMIFRSAELLLHTEAFTDSTIDLVKYSVSTKIADFLGSGKCLIAYGPSNVASISYLKENDCAYVIDSKNQLKEKLINIFTNSDLRKRKIKRALQVARQNHDTKENSSRLYEILQKSSCAYSHK